MAKTHQPERTCIGCRGVFTKGEVVRIVATPGGAVIDYREKLPGRAAYVCPRQDCIRKALGKGALSRALRANVPAPTAGDFTAMLVSAIRGRTRSLLVMAAKAGMLAAGYSAVRDALEKNAVEMIVFAEDLSEGTREKIGPLNERIARATLLSKEELGALLGREAVGVLGIKGKGFAGALTIETERLKGLLNAGQ